MATNTAAVHGYCFINIQSDKTYLSTDQGATRTPVTLPGGGNGSLGPVAWIADKFFVLHGGKVYSTTNFSSYVEVPSISLSGTSNVISPSTPDFVGFGSNGKIAFTQDGVVWQTFNVTGKTFDGGICVPSIDFENNKLLFGTHASGVEQSVQAVRAQVPEGDEFLVPDDGGGLNWIKAL